MSDLYDSFNKIIEDMERDLKKLRYLETHLKLESPSAPKAEESELSKYIDDLWTTSLNSGNKISKESKDWWLQHFRELIKKRIEEYPDGYSIDVIVDNL